MFGTSPVKLPPKPVQRIRNQSLGEKFLESVAMDRQANPIRMSETSTRKSLGDAFLLSVSNQRAEDERQRVESKKVTLAETQ
jgi:hypothetical protein